jgi:hypothetical protein
MTKKEIDRLKIWSKTQDIITGYIILNSESAIKYLSNEEYYLNKILKNEQIFLTSDQHGFEISDGYILFTAPKYREIESMKLKIKYKDILRFHFSNYYIKNYDKFVRRSKRI